MADAAAVIVPLPDGLLPGMGTPIIEDDSVSFGPKFVIPEGMTYQQAKKILRRKMEEEEQTTSFRREYLYRPMDGCYSVVQVLKEMFGLTRQQSIMTMFGPEPPQMRTIHISPTKTYQVPWGLIIIPELDDAQLYTGEVEHEDYGSVFLLTCQTKRKHKDRVDEFFAKVGEYLETGSIYRGKALIGSQEPKFLSLEKFDKGKVVYSQEVFQQLAASVWNPMRYSDAYERDGISLKRATLLYGPYGTGKTLAGQYTAWVATEEAAKPWTFIAARPGRDDLRQALQTARLYEPAVVFFEDVDERASSPEHDEMSALMEAFDGITAKGGRIQVVMTTNHVERIHKAMLRPGRLDSLIPIEALDREGIETLIKVIIAPERLMKDVDFDEVYAHMGGFFPAFVSEVCNRASAVGLGRSQGAPKYKIATEDLCIAADSLRPQLDQMEGAGEGRVRPPLEESMAHIVQGAASAAVDQAVISRGGEEFARLEPAGVNGSS